MRFCPTGFRPCVQHVLGPLFKLLCDVRAAPSSKSYRAVGTLANLNVEFVPGPTLDTILNFEKTDEREVLLHSKELRGLSLLSQVHLTQRTAPSALEALSFLTLTVRDYENDGPSHHNVLLPSFYRRTSCTRSQAKTVAQTRRINPAFQKND